MNFVEGRTYSFNANYNEYIIGYYERPFQGSEKYIQVLSIPTSFYLYFPGKFVHPKNYGVDPTVKFKGYDYIRDYLDAFISFKISNQSRTLIGTEFERAALMVLKQFISENLELIRQRHELRLTEKAAEMDAIYQMAVSGDIDIGRK